MKDQHVTSATRAAQLIQDAAELLNDSLPEIQKQLARAAKIAEELEASKLALETAEKRATNATNALQNIETAVETAIDAARETVYSNDAPLEEKLRMLDLFKNAFSHLSKAGFQIWIPQIGEPIDPERFIVRGRAKSELGADFVADVLSWGFKFPSGATRQAEVLTGSASVKQTEPQTTEKHEPTPKAGISMIVPETSEKVATKRKQPHPADTSLFDQLSQAAKKNIEKQSD